MVGEYQIVNLKCTEKSGLEDAPAAQGCTRQATALAGRRQQQTFKVSPALPCASTTDCCTYCCFILPTATCEREFRRLDPLFSAGLVFDSEEPNTWASITCNFSLTATDTFTLGLHSSRAIGIIEATGARQRHVRQKRVGLCTCPQS
jgi:hypothetical protein